VWRCSSEKTASNGSAPCKVASTPGANAASRSPPSHSPNREKNSPQLCPRALPSRIVVSGAVVIIQAGFDPRIPSGGAPPYPRVFVSVATKRFRGEAHGSVSRRRSYSTQVELRGGGGHPPHYMDECQNKGDRKWAICKWMKTQGRREFGGRRDRRNL
jgi:hypothetical protein